MPVEALRVPCPCLGSLETLIRMHEAGKMENFETEVLSLVVHNLWEQMQPFFKFHVTLYLCILVPQTRVA